MQGVESNPATSSAEPLVGATGRQLGRAEVQAQLDPFFQYVASMVTDFKDRTSNDIERSIYSVSNSYCQAGPVVCSTCLGSIFGLCEAKVGTCCAKACCSETYQNVSQNIQQSVSQNVQ